MRVGTRLEGSSLRAYLVCAARNLLINRIRRPRLVRSAADVAWLRDLARRIVRDACDADDALQDAVARSLKASGGRGVPGWWARVLRRGTIDRHREEGRRGQREAHRAEDLDRTEPSAHAVVVEAETRKLVSDAVLALGEPYRTVVLLRYSHGMSPRAIAAELDRPVGTVKVQLERARAQLRQRISRHFPSDRDFVLGLAPIAGLSGVSLTGFSSPALVTASASLVMKIAWLAPLALLAVLGVVWTTFLEPGAVDRGAAAGHGVTAMADGSLSTERGALASPANDADRQVAEPATTALDATSTAVAPDSVPSDGARAIHRGLATRIDGRPGRAAPRTHRA